jgi:hypothetical protein
MVVIAIVTVIPCMVLPTVAVSSLIPNNTVYVFLLVKLMILAKSVEAAFRLPDSGYSPTA